VAEVFVAVRGGLGNQLFQAAFGVAVEALFGAQVRYLSDYVAMDPYGRQYLLDSFPALKGKTIAIAEADGVPAYGEQGVDEASLGELLRQQPKVVFHAYWQNERYFFGQGAAIAAALRLNPSPDLAARGEALRASGAIGMHVRRSEYGHHGLAMADYYRTAVAQIRREAGPAPVVCFSDEPNVCEFVFRDIPDLTVMRSASDSPLDDFYLLGCCRHYAIANSSFSWWAAWLGSGPLSIVYAPLPWCAYDPSQQPVPSRWRAVENAVRNP
jgi:hypothetical protein